MSEVTTSHDIVWPDLGGQARGTIAGPAGALEVAVGMPKQAPRGVIVVAHPHPQQGGTLDNKVTYMAARAVTEAGFAAVRLNYRGVGYSAGCYDAGRGELEDLRATRRWALANAQVPDAGLAGFSFGAWLALRLTEADDAQSLVTIGLPAEYFDDELPRPDSPWRAIFGDADEVINVDRAIQTIRALRPTVDLEIMAEAGHFLHGRLAELRRLVGEHFDANGD